MKIEAYLIVTLLALVEFSEGIFGRRQNKHKGPFGGHLASWGSTALGGLLRYAPDFCDVVPKVAHKLLAPTIGRKHYYDDDDSTIFTVGKRAVKRIHRLFSKPHSERAVSMPVYPPYYEYGFGSGDEAFGLGGYGHYPMVISHGNFDELPVHGVFHDTIDFGYNSADLYGHDFQIFNSGYHL